MNRNFRSPLAGRETVEALDSELVKLAREISVWAKSQDIEIHDIPGFTMQCHLWMINPDASPSNYLHDNDKTAFGIWRQRKQEIINTTLGASAQTGQAIDT